VKSLLGLLSTRQGSAFRRNFVLVLRANVLAQIIAVASMPVLSRLYTSGDFGRFAVFSSAASLALSITTLRFDWLIPNSRNVLSASALMVLGLCAIVLTSTIVFIAALLAVLTLSPVVERFGLGSGALLIPIAMIGAGLVEMLQGWFVRSNDLTAVSRSKISQSYANAGVSVVGGVMGAGGAGLITAFIVSTWTGLGVLARHARQFWSSLPRLDARRVLATFVSYRREAGWSTLVSLVNATSLYGTVFVLTAFFTATEVGWYSLMLRVASGPIRLISSSLGQSFWSAAAEKARAKQFVELRKLYFRATARLALLSIPILIGCCAGPFIVGPLFGKTEWQGAGYVLLAMAPMLVAMAVFSPTNHLVVYQRQAYQLMSDVFSIVLSFLAIYVSARLHLGFATSVFMMSIAVCIAYGLRFYLHVLANTEATRVARSL
jgi:O-antigen/teichoic acid export membrane protein